LVGGVGTANMAIVIANPCSERLTGLGAYDANSNYNLGKAWGVENFYYTTSLV